MSASLLDYEASFASVFDNIWLQFIEPFVIEMINDPSLTEDKKNQFKAGYDTIPLASTPCGDFVRIKLDAKQFALQQEGHAGAKHLKTMIDCIREYDKEIVPTEKKVSFDLMMRVGVPFMECCISPRIFEEDEWATLKSDTKAMIKSIVHCDSKINPKFAYNLSSSSI